MQSRREDIDLETLILTILCKAPRKTIYGRYRLEKLIYIILTKLLERHLIQDPPTVYIRDITIQPNKDIEDTVEKLVEKGYIEIQHLKYRDKIIETIYRLNKNISCNALYIVKQIHPEILMTVEKVVKQYASQTNFKLSLYVYILKPHPKLVKKAESEAGSHV